MPLLLCLCGRSRACPARGLPAIAPVPYSPGAVKTAPYKAPVFQRPKGGVLTPPQPSRRCAASVQPQAAHVRPLPGSIKKDTS